MQTKPTKKPRHAGHGNHLRNLASVKRESLAVRMAVLDALTSEGVVLRGQLPAVVR